MTLLFATHLLAYMAGITTCFVLTRTLIRARIFDGHTFIGFRTRKERSDD